MPRRIGKYELGKTLGRGTFSKVKYGVDTETKEAFAIKIVDRRQVEKEKMETQLKREIAIMKILKHPNVVSLKEVLQTTKHIYIVLELITGGELFDRIVSAKRFDEVTARRYFQQIMLGMEYCHGQGIAHRDLKPENLLLDKNDVMKISDFGLSALSENRDGRQKMLMTTCGTPNYVAPEVLLEKGYDGFKADVWSSGVILFVMLAGYLPFDDPTMNGLFAKIEKGVFKVPRHISEEAKSLISRMLVVDPNARITIAEIKQDPWFRVNLAAVEAISSGVPQTLSVNDQMVHSSIAETQESDIDLAAAASAAAAPAAPADSMNAFDLASRLMAGNLNPLLSRSSNSIRRETRFMVNGSSEQVVGKLVQVLTDANANPKVKENEIKGYIIKQNGPFTFTIEIHSAISNGFVMVEFRRGRGDALEFNQFFRNIKEQLSDIVSTRN